MTPTRVLTRASAERSGRLSKSVLWLVMGGMTVSVFVLSELPLLGAGTESRSHLIAIRWMIVPHVLAALTALVTGAIQFSGRIRRSNLAFHRITGRVYVGSIFIAGPIALVMSYGTPFFVATVVQAGAWMVTAFMAMLMARNRQILRHRQWVVKSYAVTFGFILLHLLNPWHVWSGIGDQAYATAIIIWTFLAVLIPQVIFDWQ